jgi:hypothetical protein
MFMDALLLVSDAQAIAADAVSTNTIDLGNPTVKNKIGTGEPVGFGITVDVAADSTTGDETYAFEVISSASADLSTPTVLSRRVILAASLTAGSRHFIEVPIGTPVQRYIGLNYDVGGTTPTITVTAGLMPRSFFEEWTAYAKGYAT